jgi:mannitol-specific phosphotransferase system IIBC component
MKPNVYSLIQVLHAFQTTQEHESQISTTKKKRKKKKKKTSSNANTQQQQQAGSGTKIEKSNEVNFVCKAKVDAYS